MKDLWRGVRRNRKRKPRRVLLNGSYWAPLATGVGYNKLAFLPSLLSPACTNTHFNVKLMTLNVYIRTGRKTRSHFSALNLSYSSCPLPRCAGPLIQYSTNHLLLRTTLAGRH